MGLPMWRAPSPEPKSAAKGDVTAPARSPIRRRSPPFNNNARRARPGGLLRSPHLLDTDFFVSTSRFSPLPSQPSQSSQPGAAPRPSAVRPSTDRPRLPPPPVPESRNYARRGDSADDTIPYTRAGSHRWRRNTQDRFLAIFQSAVDTLPSQSSLPPPPPIAYTPNFAPAAAARNARADATDGARYSSTRERDLADITAFLSHGRPSDDENNDDAAGPDIVEPSDDGSDGNAVVSLNLPTLRRMGRRTVADGPLPSGSLRDSMSPDSTIDGLGDRDRSLSPSEDWGNILSTVAPDPLAPSADSSFTSAAASASFSNSHPSSRAGSSNSNSASSSRTHLTVPSRRHSPQSELLRACDTDSDTSTDTDDDEDHLRVRPSLRPSMRRREHLRNDIGPPPPLSNLERLTRINRRRRLYPQPERALGDQLDGSTDDPNPEDERAALDHEMRVARAILERLTQREEYGDDFWASVGLTRSMTDGLDSYYEQQRERSS